MRRHVRPRTCAVQGDKDRTAARDRSWHGACNRLPTARRPEDGRGGLEGRKHMYDGVAFAAAGLVVFVFLVLLVADTRRLHREAKRGGRGSEAEES